eukprot:2373147-Rhodomonas_salina.1
MVVSSAGYHSFRTRVAICQCGEGFAGPGTFQGCYNINECTSGTHNCAAPFTRCEDTDGGFNCVDVDVCAGGLHNCDARATCHMGTRAFSCVCNAGFTGSGVEGGCADIDECLSLCRDTERELCVNTVGGFACNCRAGWQASGGVCVDVNECEDSQGLCSAAEVCKNTEGGYLCNCGEGYVESDDRVSCMDVDECANGGAVCNDNAACVNEPGRFSCVCNRGYSGDGFLNCYSLNECSSGTHNCVGKAVCSNTPGSFTCLCPSGYQGVDGGLEWRCDDVDECAQPQSPCAPDASCENDAGAFSCACNSGYVGDGYAACTPEGGYCALYPSACTGNSRCVNLPGNSH